MRYPWTESSVPTEWFRQCEPSGETLSEVHQWAEARRSEYWRTHPEERVIRIVFALCFTLGGAASLWLICKEPSTFPDAWRTLASHADFSLLRRTIQIGLYVLSYTFIFGVLAWASATRFGAEDRFHVKFALWMLAATILFGAPLFHALVEFLQQMALSTRVEQLCILAFIFGFARFIARDCPLPRSRVKDR